MDYWNKKGKKYRKTLSMLLLFGIILSETAPIVDYTLGVEVNDIQQEYPENEEELNNIEGKESINKEGIQTEDGVTEDSSEVEKTEETIEEVTEEVLEDSEPNEDTKEEEIKEDTIGISGREPEPRETHQPKGMSMRLMAVESQTNYTLAKDSDFSGGKNGSFVYIGNAEYVEIPHTIKGIPVTSYKEMFTNGKVKGVKSTNKGVTDMSYMFYNYSSEELDVSQLETSGVLDMGYMFGASNASQTELIKLIGLEELNTSKVTAMNNMFTLSKAETLNLQNFNTSNVITMSAMFRDTKALTINTDSFDTRKVTNMNQVFMNTSATTLEFSKLDTSNVTTMSNMFAHTKDSTLDLSNFNTSKVTDMNYMFYASYAKTLDLSTFDTSNVTNMSAMFRSSSATSIDFSSFNTERVTNMSQMFEGSKVTKLDLRSFDTRRVATMNNMFLSSRVTDITGLNNFNTESVTNMESMFKDTVLTHIDVSNFNTGNVTYMGSMFRNTWVHEIDLSNFNTSKVKSMSAMFQGARATVINISGLDTSSVSNMGYMFKGVSNVDLDLKNFNTENATNMGYMFQEAEIKELDTSNFDTINVTNMRSMYEGSSVGRIDLRNFNTSNVTDMSNMFKDTQASYIDVSSFNTMNVLEMISMFQGSIATSLDLRSFDTYKVTDMTNMFNGAKAKNINVSRFDTSLVTSMSGMFGDTEVETIDISSFDMSSVNNIDDMFTGTKATEGLAKSRGDADKVNNSKGKPNTLVIRPKYVVAVDDDFSGTLNGYFKYTGKEKFIEIPNTIKGVNVNSYKGMFEGTSLRGVVSTNTKVTDMSNMFKDNSSEDLDVSGINTSGVTNMSGMFQNTRASYLDLRNFNTEKVTNMSSMFSGTNVNEIDLGSFDTRNVSNMDNMFNGSEAVNGYARTKEDAGRLNGSSNKGERLHFTVWGIQTTQDIEEWTNKPVTIKVTAESELEGLDYITWVNEPSRNLIILKDLVSYVGYNTPFIHDEENYSVTTTVKSDNNLVFSSKRGLEIGDVYTQSGYMYVNGEPLTQSMVRGTKLNTSEPNLTPIIVDDETGYFRQTQQNVGNTNFWMHAYGTFRFPEGTEVTISKLKVEKGTEATEWTLSPEDASTGAEPGEFTVYSNGTYVFRAIGNKGNSKEGAHTVTNIDTDKPTAEVTKSTEGWTSQDVEIYVEAKDTLSGVKSITLPDGKVVNANKATYSATENKGYTFKVTDNAGNVETYTTKVTNIDKSRPKLTATIDNNKWTRNPINIKVTSDESTSGLTDIQMISSPREGRNLLLDSGEYFTQDEEVMGISNMLKRYDNSFVDVNLLRGKNIVTSVDIEVDRYLGGRIGFETAYRYDDGSDNHYTERAWFGTTTGVGDGKPFKGRVEHKGTFLDKEMRRIAMPALYNQLDGDVDFKIGRPKVEEGTTATPWTPAPEDIPLINNSKTYPVVANGLYTFEARYNNGTTSETSVNVTNIDLEKPTIKVTDNPTDWVEDDDITLEVNAGDKLSGVKSITLPDGEVVTGGTATYKVTKNGNYTFKVTDNVGNTVSHTEKVEYLMIDYKFYVLDKNNKPVSGAEFELLRDGEAYKEAVSDASGLVDFGKIPPAGKYSIRQMSAPGGVVVPPEELEVGDVTEPIEVITYPREDTLPGTGTVELLVYTSLVVVLTSLVAMVKIKKGRKVKGN